MPKPYKLSSTRPIPPGAEITAHEGKPHVRLRDRGRAILYPLTRDGLKYLRPSKRWYFDIRDAAGTVRRVKGFTDLKATEQLAAEAERSASRVRAGFTDPAEGHARRPLVDHLADFAAYLTAKGNTTEHTELSTGRVAALLAGCGFVFQSDADAGKAAAWLTALRRGGVPVAVPPGDAFSPAATAEVLGVTGAAVRSAVKRLNLPASGNGKARRFPRATVEALALNRAKGCGPETANHYVRAVRGFFRWLVRSKRIGSNPLDALTLLNAAVDVRRARREMTADELRRLFDVTRGSMRSYRGLSGTDRYFLYLTAAGTGFRARALSHLTRADFDLDAAAPVVTLPARYAKNRRTKVQPVPPDVADALRGYLAGKPAAGPIWGGTWARDHRGAEMLRIDLETAGIAYAVEGPDGPEYADFHSLRHSYLTLGGRSGIDLRTLQELAGHSKPELTARYSHRRLYDLAGAVDKLPNLVPTDAPDETALPLRMTGTAGAKSAVPDAVTGCVERHQPAPPSNLRVVGGIEGDSPQPVEMERAGADSRRPASTGFSAPSRARTEDPLIKSQLLYQLS